MEIIEKTRRAKRKRKTVTEDIYNQILSMIVSGAYKPGDKLPSQRELEELFEVSRPTLREALSRLVVSGFITAHQGQGYFVREQKFNISIEHPFSMEDIDKKDLRNLFEARLMLEASLAAMASIFATEEECQELRKAAWANDNNKERDVNLFHKLVAKYSHNAFLAEFEESLFEVLEQIYPKAFPSLKDPNSQEKYEHVPHVKIAEAIAAHNPKEAYAESFLHIVKYVDEKGIGGKYHAWILSDEYSQNFEKTVDKA